VELTAPPFEEGPVDLHAGQPASVTLWVRRLGPPDGAPVVLLHGFPDGWSTFLHLAPALAAEGYRVVLPSQRGYGRSSVPKRVGAYAIGHLVDDVVALIDGAGGHAVHLVGHDWGGAVAWEVARVHPERVRSLTVLNCPPLGVMRRELRRNLRQLARSYYMALFQLPWLPQRFLTSERLLRGLRSWSRRDTFSPAQLEAMQATWRASGGLEGAIGWYRAALRSPLPKGPPALAGRIVAPTRLVWGTEDVALGEELAEACLADCVDGQLTTVPTSHWPHLDAVAHVRDTLLDHFATHGGVDPVVYKIVDTATWRRAPALWRGTTLDIRDGFLHLSAAEQVAGTLAKWFEPERDDLLLLAVAPERLPAGALHWEPSRDGRRFPHLYGALPRDAVTRMEPLRWNGEAYTLPAALRVRG
jgi:pimeloyl-ACP methyl ester carboxylesterase/uncharacterized protein (DUF952 family)